MDSIVMGRKVVLQTLVGSNNYNLATPESDQDWKLFVLPTFEDLYRYEKPFSKQIISAEADFDIHDVRKLVDLFYKSNLNFLEVLYSMNQTVFTDCAEMTEILKVKREIVKMNLPYLFNACGGMHKQKMALLNKGTEGTQYLVDLYGYDTKQALHAYRVINFIVRFAETDFNDFTKALVYSGEDKEFMLEIKGGHFTEENYRKFIAHYHDSQFVHMKQLYYSQPVNEELKQYIYELVMKLVKRHILKGAA